MKYRILLAILACSALQVSASDADRPVQNDGSVTFSDTPVPGNTDAPVTDTLTESQREARAVIDKANRLQQQEAAAQMKKADAGASAQQELDQANAKLEAARVVGEGDRQSLAGGGSKLTPEYLNRVQAAEKRVEEAQEKLKQAD